MSFTSAAFVLMAATLTGASTPDVYWTMEVKNNRLAPEIGNKEMYSADLLGNNVDIAPGVLGNGLKVNNTVISFGTPTLAKQNCFIHPKLCAESGITFAAWTNILRPSSLSISLGKCLISSSSICSSTPQRGFTVGEDGQNIFANVYLDNGTIYKAKAGPIAYNSWTRIGVTWTAAAGIKIYFNGSEAHEYIGRSTTNSNSQLGHLSQNLKLGSNGFTFWIDESKLWNRAISPAEMLQASKPIDVVVPQTSTTAKRPQSSATRSSSLTASTTTGLYTTTSQQAQDTWKWLVVVLCIILLLIIIIMLCLLLRRKRRRRGQFQPIVTYQDASSSRATSSVTMEASA